MRGKILLAAPALFLVIAASSPRSAVPTRNASWEKIDVATNASFRGLSAASTDIVWASGTEGTVVRTLDGGATWSVRKVAGAEKLDLRGIHAFDADSAVIMSSGNAEEGQARIYRTTDGGQNWKLVYELSTRGIFFDAVAFWDAQHGIVISDPVEGRFALFTTDDGGASWNQVAPAGLPPALANEGAFAASNSCLTVEGANNAWFVTGGANVARVFRSTDRGKSWKAADTPMHPANASTGLFSVAFRDASNGIAVGGDYAHPSGFTSPVVFFSRDGGATWQPGAPTDPPGFFLSSVVYVPAKAGSTSAEGEVIAAGTGGIQSMNSAGAWKRESEENLNALAVTSSGRAWAVGSKGTVLHTR